MAVLTKGTTFATGDQVTATNLNNLVDSATFASGAVDNSTTQLSSGAIIVKDTGITSAKLSTTIINSLTTVTLASGDSIAISDVSDSNTNKKGLISDLYTSAGSFGGQLKFPATQSASADANTLDDYEEGTWTPSVGGTATYTTQTGTYTKIGRLVFVRGTLIINSIGSGSTSTISGLPFSAADNTAGCVTGYTGLALSVTSLSGIVTGTSFQLNGHTAAATSITNAIAVLQNASEIAISATYQV